MSQKYAGGMITANQNSNYSGLFNGTANFLSFAGAAQYAIATSTTPFTIEAWIRPTAAGGLIFSEDFVATPSIPITCGLVATNDLGTPTGVYPAFGYYSGSWTNAAVSTTPVQLNVWTHVAFVFTGATSKIYINGVDVTSPSSPTPATTWGVTGINGSTWYIGRRWDTTAGGTYFKGNISNFRFVNGSAVYTSNFAPPAKLSAITNTVLLTCQDATFFDASTYAVTITNNGSTIVSDANPFYLPSDPALGAATPGVWTLSQAAAAAAQRSWPMYDPEFNFVTGMVHGNGTNGGNNNTFLDSSTNNFSVTRNGNTTQGTYTPFSRTTGYWSNFFDGTTDYITVAGNSNLAFGTNDFTIELFFWSTTLVGFLYDGRTAASQAVPTIFISGSTLVYYVSGGNRIVSNNIVARQWYHVVVSRVSGNTRMFIDGAQQGVTYLDATNYINNTNRPIIGANGNTPSSYFSGYISNLRVLNGTGVTSPTVPTLPLTAITNTQLLTCQSNSFADKSTNNFSLTKVNDVRVTTFVPFFSPTAYSPEVNGGALLFDGTGDYLTLTGSSNLAFGTSDFTIECFVYFTSTATFQTIYDSRPSGTSSGAYPALYYSSSPALFYYYVDGANRIASDAAPASGQWIHLVVSRVSGTTRMFVNGVAQTQTWSDTTTYLNGASRPVLGSTGDVLNNPLFGYLSNVRVLKGTGVTSVTVPTAPLSPITNTQLLLSGTNASFIDNASSLTIETVNTTISTTKSKYGSGSMSFDGATTYAKITTQFGDGGRVIGVLGDFTAECWINPTTVNAQRCIFNLNTNANGFGAIRLDHANGGAVQLLASSNGTGYAINTTSTTVLPTGLWTHLAVVRAGPAIIVYFNGSPIITGAVSIGTTLVVGSQSLIGALSISGVLGYWIDGYISDFRTTNYARYLGTFTPPTSTLQNQ